MDNQENLYLGIVGMSPKGEYNSQTRYEKLNVVSYNGSSYCAKMTTQGNLPTNTDYWDLIAEKGGTGPQGPKPVKGTDYFTEDDITSIENDLKPTITSDVRDEVTSQLSSLTSATPLGASSMSDMTDTTRIYVLTTDGHWYWYDGTSWVDGGVYQATEDSDTLTELQETVDEIGYVTENLFDINSEDFHDNGYYHHNQGEDGCHFVEDDRYACAIIKLKGTGNYTVSATNYSTYRLTENKGFQSTYGTTGKPNTIGVSSDTVKYLAVSWSKNKVNPANYMCVKGDTLPESYVPYGFVLKDNISLSETQRNEVLNMIPNSEEKYVVASSGGDYTGIIEALWDLQGNTNKKTIVVMPGIYDIFEEYGGSTWHLDPENQNKSYHELCPFVPKNTTIIGVGEVVFRYKPASDETTRYMAGQISPINIQETCEIKNIKIDCDYCRYAIHVETGSEYINENVKLTDLNIVKLNTDGSSVAIGCGGTTGLNLTIDNCYVRGNLGSFSIHDNGTSQQNGMNIFLKNSTFVKKSQASTRNTLRFSNCSQANVHNVYINNCYFTDLKLSYESDLNDAKNGYKIIVSNCSDYDIKYKYEYDNDYVIYNYNTTVNSITNESGGHYN